MEYNVRLEHHVGSPLAVVRRCAGRRGGWPEWTPEMSNAPGVTKDHELFVCLQVDVKRAWRQMKRSGGTDGPEVGALRIARDECLGEHDELRAIGGGLGC